MSEQPIPKGALRNQQLEVPQVGTVDWFKKNAGNAAQWMKERKYS